MRTQHARRLRSAWLILAAAVVAAAFASPPTRYEIVGGSRFWIDGASTLGHYRCDGSDISGSGVLHDGSDAVAGELVVPVASLDCGRARMTRDLRKALSETEHPEIRVVVDAARVQETGGTDWVPVQARARIRLAGVERVATLQAEGRPLDAGRVQVRGVHPLRMTDFGIQPPTGLGGLVRAHDDVRVQFDLVAASR